MNKQDSQNLRFVSALVLHHSLPSKSKDLQQQSLQVLFTKHFSDLHPQSKALAKNICYGVFRHYFLLNALLNEYLNKPLKVKDSDLHALLLAASYELFYLNTPEHAVISESVNLCEKMNKPWAKGLINAVLRNIQRSKLNPASFKKQLEEKSTPSEEIIYEHPAWLIDRLRKDWPTEFKEILSENNLRAPMTLRVNASTCNQNDYLNLLLEKNIQANLSPETPNCIYLHDALDVEELPGFQEGFISVQDEAAQQAAPLLNLQAGQKVLDACSAPGGKSAHILELEPSVSLTCLDINAERLAKVEQNFARLNQKAVCIMGDAAYPDLWWDGSPFDRILLDAPCSASGIIRRNPDIKLQRNPTDIRRLAAQQTALLEALWPCLKSGGLLLYSTCSVLKEENQQVIESFLAKKPSARIDEFSLPLGKKTIYGQQLFPLSDHHDGFFYARLIKL